jgi:hypothetical protein
MDPQRRSSIVMLTLVGLPLGAVVLADVLPEGQQMRRNLYTDRASCERDYSQPQCEQRTSGGGVSGGFYGPYYSANRNLPAARTDAGPGRVGLATSSETSVRGGFGAFGRALHAVG